MLVSKYRNHSLCQSTGMRDFEESRKIAKNCILKLREMNVIICLLLLTLNYVVNADEWYETLKKDLKLKKKDKLQHEKVNPTIEMQIKKFTNAFDATKACLDKKNYYGLPLGDYFIDRKYSWNLNGGMFENISYGRYNSIKNGLLRLWIEIKYNFKVLSLKFMLIFNPENVQFADSGWYSRKFDNGKVYLERLLLVMSKNETVLMGNELIYNAGPYYPLETFVYEEAIKCEYGLWWNGWTGIDEM